MTHDPLPTSAATLIPLDRLLAEYAPYEHRAWTWDDEEAEILRRECICCGRPGHYQAQLEAHLMQSGLTEGVCLGEAHVADGHHRVIAARRLGIEMVPVESGKEAGERWLRDHGAVSFHARKFGDRSPWEKEWREAALRGDYGEWEQAQARMGEAR